MNSSSPRSPKVAHAYETLPMSKWYKTKKQLPLIYMLLFCSGPKCLSASSNTFNVRLTVTP